MKSYSTTTRRKQEWLKCAGYCFRDPSYPTTNYPRMTTTKISQSTPTLLTKAQTSGAIQRTRKLENAGPAEELPSSYSKKLDGKITLQELRVLVRVLLVISQAEIELV